jgi:hypothetical protein
VVATLACNPPVSYDVGAAWCAVAGSPATLSLALSIPAAFAGQQFFVQHLCLEPVAGGLSFSNGLAVRIP